MRVITLHLCLSVSVSIARSLRTVQPQPLLSSPFIYRAPRDTYTIALMDSITCSLYRPHKLALALLEPVYFPSRIVCRVLTKTTGNLDHDITCGLIARSYGHSVSDAVSLLYTHSRLAGPLGYVRGPRAVTVQSLILPSS